MDTHPDYNQIFEGSAKPKKRETTIYELALDGSPALQHFGNNDAYESVPIRYNLTDDQYQELMSFYLTHREQDFNWRYHGDGVLGVYRFATRPKRMLGANAPGRFWVDVVYSQVNSL